LCLKSEPVSPAERQEAMATEEYEHTPLTNEGQKMIDDAVAATMIDEMQRENDDTNNANDIADNHKQADELLCAILRQHGYEKTVQAFERLMKYYA
jgi:hypothetical protein